MADQILTQERLKELVHYDHETGIFTRRVSMSNRVRVGSVAGTVNGKGYVVIKIDGNRYRAHRLAWLYVHGDLPPEQLDHINRIKSDNRIGNLRLANNAENHQNMPMPRNNTSGHVGVYWFKRDQKWAAQIKINHKTINLGYFTEISEAIAARKAAELHFHTFQNSAIRTRG